MNTTKLRVVVSPRGWVAAWFPESPMDGKLFWDSSACEVTEFMYARRLRKQIFKGL